MPKPASISPVMTQIDTIVYIMMENRSFDSLLGWLYGNPSTAIPNPLPAGSTSTFNGLTTDLSNSYRGTNEPVSYGTNPSPRTHHTAAFAEPMRVPRYDPKEPYWQTTAGYTGGVVNQLYADGDGNLPDDPWPSTPPMSGFAFDYAEAGDSPQEVMGAYTPGQLPILNGLALNFAVSDRWFSSVPTQTDANRAFAVCGTSLGGVVNGTPETYDTPTLFNVLGENSSKTWAIYYQFQPSNLFGKALGKLVSGNPNYPTQCYTTQIFPQAQDAVNAGQGSLDDYATFVSQAQAGTLPNFCYLEPNWGGGVGDAADHHNYIGIQGNDYHPAGWLGPAEAYLLELFQLLTSCRQWDNMLLVITFDEHGGTYDHEPPTMTVAPDDSAWQAPFKNQWNFQFQRLGVRVPTILVSPYITPGTVFRANVTPPDPTSTDGPYDFDHTSMIATILKWAGIDPSSAGLGSRVAIAPTFESVFSATTSGAAIPSLSTPKEANRPGYASQGGGTGTVAPRILGGLDDKDIESLISGMTFREIANVWGETRTKESFLARLRELKSKQN